MTLIECGGCHWVGPEELAIWVIKNMDNEDSEFDARCPKCLSGEIGRVEENDVKGNSG